MFAVVTADYTCFPKECNFFVLIGTPYYIKYIPIVDDKFRDDFTFVHKTNFVPCSIATLQCRRAICGSERGDLYITEFDTQKAQFIIRSAESLISLRNLVHLFVQFPQIPIIQICSDHNCFVTRNSQNKIQFYSFNDHTISHIGNYSSDEIVSVCSTGLFFNDYPVFIAFAVNGDRLIFAYKSQNKLWRYNLTSRITLPPKLSSSELKLISGSYFLGVSILLTENEHVVLRSCPNEGSIFTEYFEIFKIPGKAISITQIIPLNLCPFYMNDSNLWQHFCELPICIILTDNGGLTLVPKFICETNKNHNKSDPILQLDELLLLCSLYPEDKNRFLFQICSRLQEDSTEENLISPLVGAFYYRACILISPFWKTQVFTQKTNLKWTISSEFYQLPPGIPLLIRDLIELTKEVINYRKSMDFPDNSKIIDQDEINLKNLADYLTHLLEYLKFVCLIGRQKSEFLTKTFKYIQQEREDQDYDEMESLTFDNPLLQDKLRLLIFSYFKILPDEYAYFAKQIGSECPLLLFPDEQLLKYSLDELSLLQFHPKDQQKIFLNKLFNIFCDLARNPLPLSTISQHLLKTGFYEESIRIVLSRCHHIDPKNSVLKWFKNGCQPNEFMKKLFDEIYFCYDTLTPLFQIENGNQILFSIQDELFHLAFVLPNINLFNTD